MSNNLGRTEVTAGENQKEVRINASDGVLDAAVTDQLAKTVTNTNAQTLSQAEMRLASTFLFTDNGTPPTAAITVTVGTPFLRGLFAVINGCSFEMTVIETGQTPTAPVIPPGGMAVLVLDAAGVRPADGLHCYDIPFDYRGGPPTSSEVIAVTCVVRDVYFPADFTGSVGNIGTNPTLTFDIDVQDDTVSIGTISIGTGGVFTFTTTSNTAKLVAAGSVLEFIAPVSADASAADIAATLLGMVVSGT